jgi:ABC-type nitrate/sulfonate/bicarbonate transport system substrate-binding protein
LRYWLAAAGIDPDHDVRLVVVPPPLMVDAMATGHVDGFCVGAPWPSLAVEAGVGHVVATTARMKPSSPEKVLGVRETWAERHPDHLDRLVRALLAACDWCDDPDHVEELSLLLAQSQYVDAPAEVIRRSLNHEIIAHPGGEWRAIPDYIRFSGVAANRPRVEDALWYATQMVRWGQVGALDDAVAAARDTFRPDLYDRALGTAPVGGDPATITLFDGTRFDPARPSDYLAVLAQSGT